MLTNKWCVQTLNASRMTKQQVDAEVEELCVALRDVVYHDADMNDVWNALSDVCYVLQCYVFDTWGLVLPMMGAKRTIRKIHEQIDVWHTIFEKHDLVFDVKYINNDSHVENEENVRKVLALAYEEQKKGLYIV